MTGATPIRGMGFARLLRETLELRAAMDFNPVAHGLPRGASGISGVITLLLSFVLIVGSGIGALSMLPGLVLDFFFGYGFSPATAAGFCTLLNLGIMPLAVSAGLAAARTGSLSRTDALMLPMDRRSLAVAIAWPGLEKVGAVGLGVSALGIAGMASYVICVAHPEAFLPGAAAMAMALVPAPPLAAMALLITLTLATMRGARRLRRMKVIVRALAAGLLALLLLPAHADIFDRGFADDSPVPLLSGPAVVGAVLCAIVLGTARRVLPGMAEDLLAGDDEPAEPPAPAPPDTRPVVVRWARGTAVALPLVSVAALAGPPWFDPWQSLANLLSPGTTAAAALAMVAAGIEGGGSRRAEDELAARAAVTAAVPAICGSVVMGTVSNGTPACIIGLAFALFLAVPAAARAIRTVADRGWWLCGAVLFQVFALWAARPVPADSRADNFAPFALVAVTALALGASLRYATPRVDAEASP